MKESNRSYAGLTRRGFIGIGCTAAAAGILSLWGCSTSTGGSSSTQPGTITMLNSEDWMGENEVADFQQEAGISVDQLPTPAGGNSAWVSILTQNKGTYDMALAGNNVASQLKDNGLLADFDASKVPNLSNIPQEYRDAYPYGIPVERGKIGFMYNTDLVSNPPQSWKDMFARAKEFSGMLLFPSYDGDVIEAGLLALGYDMNTTDTSKINEARDAVIAIKPFIKAFVDSGAPAQVVDGSAAIAVAYDYDYASAAAESDKVAWIAPSEGMPGYLDGWVPLAGSQNLDAVYEFMNFHLDPENYADFIDTTWASWVMPDIENQLDPDVADCEALQPDQPSKVIYAVITPEISKANAAAWQEIQNA